VEKKLEGYQILEQEFFRLCRIRKIENNSILLLIYLRGLYRRFGKPAFYYPDAIVREALGISKQTLQVARKKLQERGVIEYKTFSGRGHATEYLMLRTELAPEIQIKGMKTIPIRDEKHPNYHHRVSSKRDEFQPSKVFKKEQKKEVFVPMNRTQLHVEAEALTKMLDKIGRVV
jgi:MarR-like DNA-binding transcriptional regulator SgrR of sgrS sRNA